MEDRKTSILIDEEDFEEEEIDFGDFLVADLAQTIKDINGFCHGGSLPLVHLGNTSITINEQDVTHDARERLSGLAIIARRVMEEEPQLHPLEVVGPILDLDGWSWTTVTLRTPLWLHDVQEWPLVLVSDWHEELRCLETSISS